MSRHLDIKCAGLSVHTVVYSIITISCLASSTSFQHGQPFLLQSTVRTSTLLRMMTQCLWSGYGSPVKLDNYYWAYFDQKQTLGQMRKRKTAPRARRRYTRRNSHKLSRSNKEDLNHVIVRITSLEPLCGTFLAWTDSLDLKEDWGKT